MTKEGVCEKMTAKLYRLALSVDVAELKQNDWFLPNLKTAEKRCYATPMMKKRLSAMIGENSPAHSVAVKSVYGPVDLPRGVAAGRSGPLNILCLFVF